MEPQNSYKGFKDLNCWKESRELRKHISDISKTFPASEKFQLVSQIVRASRSVCANIAEGYGRYTYADTRHFFIQARGSVTETLEHLFVALDEKYITENVFTEYELQCEKVFKLINGYISYLERSQKTTTKINSSG